MLSIAGAVLALIGFLALLHIVALSLGVAIVLLVVGLALVAYDGGYARPRRRL